MPGENELRPSAWTTDTLYAHIQRQLDDLRIMLDERYATQVKAVDAAFAAQQQAMTTALAAAERAVACVASDTPVLCADLVWRSAGDLIVGDELIALDDDAMLHLPRGRRYRRATVIANSIRPDHLLRVNTNRGSVRCNEMHPWLSRYPKERWRWVRAVDLRPDDEVMNTVDVWEVDRSFEGGWLSGMFDGEGCLCFKNSPNGKARLSIVQRESETAEAIEAALKPRLDYFGIRHRQATVQPGRNNQAKVEFEINARADIMKILGSVRPPRLLARADQVWENFPISGNDRSATVISVDDDGPGTIASLTTSTGTYIAGGFAMHNTALQSAEKAVSKAEVAQEKRLESVNEFRGQLSDQAATFVRREDVDIRLNALGERLQETNTKVTKLEENRVGQTASRGSIYAFIGAAVGLIGITLAIILAVKP